MINKCVSMMDSIQPTVASLHRYKRTFLVPLCDLVGDKMLRSSFCGFGHAKMK